MGDRMMSSGKTKTHEGNTCVNNVMDKLGIRAESTQDTENGENSSSF